MTTSRGPWRFGDVAITVTPGSAPPDESVTRPEMVPVGTWALAIAAERVRQTRARNTFTRIRHPFCASARIAVPPRTAVARFARNIETPYRHRHNCGGMVIAIWCQWTAIDDELAEELVQSPR